MSLEPSAKRMRGDDGAPSERGASLDDARRTLESATSSLDDVKNALRVARDVALAADGDAAHQALELVLDCCQSQVVNVRQPAVSLVVNRLLAADDLSVRIVERATSTMFASVNADAEGSGDAFAARAALFFALCTKRTEDMLKLIPWFVAAPAVAQSVALNMIGPLACAVVDASPHLAQFVRHYVDTPLARPLILAALAAKWRLSGTNEDAPQLGAKQSPPLPPGPGAVSAVLAALREMLPPPTTTSTAATVSTSATATTAAASAAKADDNESSSAPTDDPAYAQLLLFVAPYIARAELRSQLGAMISAPTTLIEAALRIFGVERLAAIASRRFPPIKTPLAVFLIDAQLCDASRAPLVALARFVDCGVRVAVLDYVGVQQMLSALHSSAKVPSLTLKTLLVIVDVYPTFKNLIIATLELLAKKPPSIWDDAVLWKGLSIAIAKLQPSAFVALTALPTLMREKFFVANPQLIDTYRAHVAAEKARLDASAGPSSMYARQLISVPQSRLSPSSSCVAEYCHEDDPLDGKPNVMATTPSSNGDITAVLSLRRPAQMRVVSYASLADNQAKPDRFPYCAPSLLLWDNRKKQLAAEILHYKPDLICLQQAEYYRAFFEPEMHKEGYGSLYKQRTGSGPQDGVAIFWRKDRYRFILEHKLEYNDLAYVNPNVPASRRLLRDCVALVAVFDPVQHEAPRGSRRRVVAGGSGAGGGGVVGSTGAHVASFDDDVEPRLRDTRQRVMVACTELAAEQRFADVRVMQTKMLLELLEKLSAGQMPILICGALNSTPDSAVCELLRDGSLSAQNQENVSAQFKLFAPVRHRLALRSAYADVLGAEPEFTSFTHAASATTDFIFYTAPKLDVVAALAMPNRVDIERDTALPSHSNCSDHLMHVAVFECKASSN